MSSCFLYGFSLKIFFIYDFYGWCQCAVIKIYHIMLKTKHSRSTSNNFWSIKMIKSDTLLKVIIVVALVWFVSYLFHGVQCNVHEKKIRPHTIYLFIKFYFSSSVISLEIFFFVKNNTNIDWIQMTCYNNY